MVESVSSYYHAADLVERHAITMAPEAKKYETSKDLSLRRQRVWAAQADQAERWALANDVAIEIEVFEHLDDDDQPRTWGVRWQVVIGRGAVGDAKSWNWSNRFRGWLSVLEDLARPELVCHQGGNVLPMRRRGRK